MQTFWILHGISTVEVVHEETEEQESQDPVDRVDVDNDQSDVEEPAAHVDEVQSFQAEACMSKAPTSMCVPCVPLISWKLNGYNYNLYSKWLNIVYSYAGMYFYVQCLKH